MRQIRAAALALFGVALTTVLLHWPQTLVAQAVPALTPGDIVAQHGVPMKTRDGVTLYADIYRPSSAGKFPVIRQEFRCPGLFARPTISHCSPVWQAAANYFPSSTLARMETSRSSLVPAITLRQEGIAIDKRC